MNAMHADSILNDNTKSHIIMCYIRLECIKKYQLLHITH